MKKIISVYIPFLFCLHVCTMQPQEGDALLTAYSPLESINEQERPLVARERRNARAAEQNRQQVLEDVRGEAKCWIPAMTLFAAGTVVSASLLAKEHNKPHPNESHLIWEAMGTLFNGCMTLFIGIRNAWLCTKHHVNKRPNRGTV